ncbi:MAG: CHAT domain-containing protein [Myxococcota bacterium]
MSSSAQTPTPPRQRPWHHRIGLGTLAVAVGTLAWTLVSLNRSLHSDSASPPSATPSSAASSATPSAVAPLPVQWGGCTSVALREDTLVCQLDRPGSLQLWIEDPRADALVVEIDDRSVATERHAVGNESGQGLRVTVPEGARVLTVRPGDPASLMAPWSLALAPPGAEPPEGLRRAYAELRTTLRGDDPEATGQATQRAIDIALHHGRLSEAVDLGLAVAHQLSTHRQGIPTAEHVLRALKPLARRYPKGRGDLAAYQGLHHWYRGAIQDAAESLRDATRVALRLEDPGLCADAIPMYAETLAELGYFDDARHWAREGLRIVRGRRPACELGSALRTVGWVNLLLRQRDRPHDDPTPFLVEALEVFGPEGACPRPTKRGGARLSLALLALEQGRLDDAATELRRIDRDALSIDERVHLDDAAIRLALARGDSRAARGAHEQLRHSVVAADTADARWRLHTRRGRLRQRQGQSRGAIEAYRAAEGELDTLVRLRAVGIGRGELADRYHESTAALVSQLVHRRDIDQAWCIVRQDQARRRTAAVAPSALDSETRARLDGMIQRYRVHKRQAESLRREARALPRDQMRDRLHAAAQARAHAGTLANELVKTLGQVAPHPRCAELSPPRDGELLLGIYPRERDWLVFADDGMHTTVHPIPPPVPDHPPSALTSSILASVDRRLADATRIRVLAHRRAQRIDVHALPWRGAPLGVQRPVSYGVELPALPLRDPPSGAPRALLIADPTDTLERAQAEVREVDEHLTAAGWSTSVLLVDRPSEHPRASASGMVSLAGYDLFHYAGHAEASAPPSSGGWPPYAGGNVGWAAFLELGRAGRLTVHDVLTMRPAPRAAVLAGCRTGVRQLDTGQTSMALALLVAGGQQVVASTEAIDDAQGARFARGLYETVADGSALDLVLAMHHAQRERWRTTGSLADVRVWVR